LATDTFELERTFSKLVNVLEALDQRLKRIEDTLRS